MGAGGGAPWYGCAMIHFRMVTRVTVASGSSVMSSPFANSLVMIVLCSTELSISPRVLDARILASGMSTFLCSSVFLSSAGFSAL